MARKKIFRQAFSGSFKKPASGYVMTVTYLDTTMPFFEGFRYDEYLKIISDLRKLWDRASYASAVPLYLLWSMHSVVDMRLASASVPDLDYTVLYELDDLDVHVASITKEHFEFLEETRNNDTLVIPAFSLRQIYDVFDEYCS